MNVIKPFKRPALFMGSAALALLGAVRVEAHAKVVSVVPIADSTVASPNLIQVHFNEAVEVKLSRLKLTSSDGAAVSTMGMNEAKDPSTLSIMPNSALKPGTYVATWSAVTGDGHKVSGTFKFTVK